MKRYDLRHLKDDFYGRMGELIESDLRVGEVGIFLFEVGDFSHIQKSADFIKELGHELMNSLKFNEVDWTIVVKKLDEATIEKRRAEAKKAEEEAKKKAEEEKAQKEQKTKASVKKTETKEEK
jgi:NADH-quinone oxidoreductase subunit E